MASRYEVEVKLSSAKNLKNVNWRNGPNRPYAVVWVEPSQKFTTNADEVGDTEANWDEKLLIPLPPGATIDDSTLFIDVVHTGSDPDTKPLIGSAQLRLGSIKEDAGIGERVSRTLKLKRPSGRPQGTVDVKVTIKDNGYRARAAYDAPSYGIPPPGSYSAAPPAYGNPYSAPPPTTGYTGYNAPPPTTGYGGYGAPPPTTGYTGYNAPPPTTGYTGYSAPPPTTGYSGYGAPAPYGQASSGYGQVEQKKSKFGGLGTGLAVGAIAGGLGALALGKGIDIMEDKIADRAAHKVEEDELYDDESYSD